MRVNDPEAARDLNIQSDFDNLESLRDVCKTCVRCDLARTRTQVVFGDGPYLPPRETGIMVFGEAPGQEEDARGKPFIGRSGRLVQNLLEQAGLPRKELWITNTVKCRPVAIDNGNYKNRPPTRTEEEACEIWRRNEIRLLRPYIILCLGATAAKAMGAGKNFQITKDRGRWLPGPEEIELFVTFHPAYIIRQHGPALAEVTATVLQDFKNVKERLEALRAGKAERHPWQKDEESSGQMSLF